MSRLAVDIGGTFTDVVLELGDSHYSRKVLTTHDSPAEAVLRGTGELIRAHDVSPANIDLVLHGTTLATNAIIERKGAKTAFLTTEGHRDVLAMAFENRFEQYDVNIERPDPLVPRFLRLPIRERMSAQGEPIRKLDMGTVDDAIATLRAEEVESVAIGFLHAYANGDHEEQVGQRIAQALPNVAVTLSSKVCPEIREYERFSTACTNAYVLPLMSTYLTSLAMELTAMGVECPFMVMTSNGGLTTLENATNYPIRLVESGPAGGAILATSKAAGLNAKAALSFDMGGTTAKICLIDAAKPLRSRTFEVDRRYRFKKGSGLPVRIPVIEMVEIGAGGGSIAQVDRMSRTRVGPESAGSEPGPACYGLSGKHATVTDADAVLGRLEASKFAGGQLSLDLTAAKSVVDANVGRQLGIEAVEAAHVISEVVDENMAAAARSHASEWGKALTDRVLIAYGGAAPIHAARLMEKLSCTSALIPVNAGVGSAVGFLHSPIAYEVVASRYMRLSEFEQQAVDAVFQTLRQEAYDVIRPAIQDAQTEEVATAYMRYVGQGFEINVEVDPEHCTKKALQWHFEQAYESLYGRLLPRSDIEVMSWTMSVQTAANHPEEITLPEQRSSINGQYRTQTLHINGIAAQATCIDRDTLSSGMHVTGPALITETHTTTVLPIGYEVIVADSLDLVMRRAER